MPTETVGKTLFIPVPFYCIIFLKLSIFNELLHNFDMGCFAFYVILVRPDITVMVD